MADTGNLRNEDFRRLLAEKKTTASTTVSETPSRGSGPSFSHKITPKDDHKKKGGHGHVNKHKKDRRTKGEEESGDEDDDANLKDILKNYRDRAAERRKVGDEGADDARLTAAYRAVPGDPRQAADAAEKRKMAIEESKYLGGDMEHTHLVKGLDYSLLNKVRSEIAKTGNEVADEDLDKAYALKEHTSEPLKESDNKMVRNMHRVLFKEEFPLRNELFGKGRMAYVVDMEEEDAEIPTTLLRSVHDCPLAESNASINTNNMLISKLTEVLAYLRTDNKKKKKGAEMPEEERVKHKNDSIYDNEADYVPKRDKDDRRERKDDRDRGRKDDKDRDRKDRDYFDRDRRDRDRRDRHDDRDRHRGRDHDRDRRDTRDHRDRDRAEREKREDREKVRERERKEREEQEQREKEKRLEEKLEKRKKETEGYDECYPGGMAELGGGWDSDEEDLTKMDGSAKKGPIKRWDFEHEEDYEKYQGQREAMPKAAYQFGLKTTDGRKTRKTAVGGDNGDKKLDRELNQINKIMEKRKQGADHGDAKRPKY